MRRLCIFALDFRSMEIYGGTETIGMESAIWNCRIGSTQVRAAGPPAALSPNARSRCTVDLSSLSPVYGDQLHARYGREPFFHG